MKIRALASMLDCTIPAALLAALLLSAASCNKTAAPASQPAARSDQQIFNDIQAKIAAESALGGQGIQVGVQGGVATLSGTVSDNASRSLAGNDAGTVDGVKTVVNDLVAQTVQTVQAVPAPVTAQAPAPPPLPTPRRERHPRAAPRPEYHPEPVQEEAPPPVQPPPPVQAQAPVPPPAQAAPPTPPPPPRPVAVTVTVPAGTNLPVRISEPLDSSNAQANDGFHGALAVDIIVDGVVALPRGAAVTGRVVDARDAAHFKGSSFLSIELTEVTARGREVPVVTDAYSQEGAGRGKNTAAKAGGGAALGAIIGALAGGGKGAAIGAAAGGGLGAGSNSIHRGEQVSIPTETVVNFNLQSPITVTTLQKAGRPGGPETESDDRPTLQPR